MTRAPAPPGGRPVGGASSSYTAVGRRKRAVARVLLQPGNGNFIVNGLPLDQRFPRASHQAAITLPLRLTNRLGSMNVLAKVIGGGTTGQAGSLRLGVARALTLVDPENRPSLKKAGFLTRDARVKERKKYGLKKARKAPQYSKR